MERKLEKAISSFANAIFGDFLNHYVVESLSFYVCSCVMETKIGKMETLFLMYFCGVRCFIGAPLINGAFVFLPRVVLFLVLLDMNNID